MKVLGFIIHTGYVESAHCSTVNLLCEKGYFTSIKEALNHLAHYLLDDYLENNKRPSLDGFTYYIRALPTYMASEDPVFCSFHWNEEIWSPWNSLGDLYPFLEFFYENDEPFEEILPHYLDVKKIKNKELKKEVKKLQTPPKDKWERSLWDNIRSEERFVKVAREIKLN